MGAYGCGLRDADQLLARQFEQRQEGHDEVRDIRVLGEERRELDIGARAFERLQHAAHLAAHRKLLARDEVMPVDAGALHESRPRRLQVLRPDVGEPFGGVVVEVHAHEREVAVGERMRVDRARRLLHPLVLEQPAHELGARILRLLARLCRRLRKQQPRLDLDEHRSHQQVLGRELEVRAPHHLDVAQVLLGELGHRDVEHVDVLPADQVEQQVERALERLEEHLERLGRNVEVVRQVVVRLAVDARERLRVRRRVLEVDRGFSHTTRPSRCARRASSRRRACARARTRPRRCCARARDRRCTSARARAAAPARG